MEQIAPNTLQALSLKGDLGRGGFSSGNVYLKMGRKNFPPSQPNLPQGSQDTQNFAQGAQNAQDAQNTEGDQGTQDDQAQDTEKPSNIFHDMSLALKIGMMLGQGHSGVVFDVSPDTEDGFTSTDLPESAIPPLVVKIARREHEVDIDREAWFYNHMESIQGSVIPRCYGYFITTDFKVEAVDSRYDGTPGSGSIGGFKTATHLLLLEKLSDERLPKFISYINTPLEAEICALFEELCAFKVRHRDICWRNIAKVLPGTKDSEMPTSHRTSRYRVFDFALSERVSHNEFVELNDVCYMLDGLEGGMELSPKSD